MGLAHKFTVFVNLLFFADIAFTESKINRISSLQCAVMTNNLNSPIWGNISASNPQARYLFSLFGG